MNCDFCGDPLDHPRHPLTGHGSRDVTGCQAGWLLRKNGELETRLAEIIAWFDVAQQNYDLYNGTVVDAWPLDWLRATRPLLTGDSNG